MSLWYIAHQDGSVFRIPAPECSLIAWPNVTALSVGDAIFLSKFLGQESPSQPFSCFAALNWSYINIT